ncbi:MAG: EAL domain-containing response regulator [Nevskia sp.]|nr:EAL domain-containing response regulator [Nevskia sp.]
MSQERKGPAVPGGVRPAATPALTAVESRPPQRVLIIDADDAVCLAITDHLRAAGIEDVLTVGDGAQAVRLLNESAPYTLIISDLLVPRVDGIQLMRLIAARQTEAAVLFISSAERKLLSSAEDLARTRGLRVLSSLQKPLSPEALQSSLAELEGAAMRPSARAAAPMPTAADLRRAIERDEIRVYAQPQLDARDGQLHGVETLARWYSSGYGVISPGYFVPLAEKSGLIDELTELMLRKSFAVCGAWRRSGLITRMSVNAPISSMCRLNLPDTIAALAERNALDVCQLTLEITESGFMQDPVRSLDVLTRLRLRGIGLAIDDFGCGYSTLQQLKRMPFNELKIDCSFVMSMFRDRESRSIVRSSLDLAHELGLQTVAEGVETREHWGALTEMGCDVVQGYHIARPFPAEQLPSWSRRQAQAGGTATAA